MQGTHRSASPPSLPQTSTACTFMSEAQPSWHPPHPPHPATSNRPSDTEFNHMAYEHAHAFDLNLQHTPAYCPATSLNPNPERRRKWRESRRELPYGHTSVQPPLHTVQSPINSIWISNFKRQATCYKRRTETKSSRRVVPSSRPGHLISTEKSLRANVPTRLTALSLVDI